MRILVANNDKDGLRAMDEVLTAAGFTVIAVATGQAVLDELASNECNITAMVFHDDMPDMTGMDILQAIRCNTAYDRIPIAVYSYRIEMADEIWRAGGVLIEQNSRTNLAAMVRNLTTRTRT